MANVNKNDIFSKSVNETRENWKNATREKKDGLMWEELASIYSQLYPKHGAEIVGLAMQLQANARKRLTANHAINRTWYRLKLLKKAGLTFSKALEMEGERIGNRTSYTMPTPSAVTLECRRIDAINQMNAEPIFSNRIIDGKKCFIAYYGDGLQLASQKGQPKAYNMDMEAIKAEIALVDAATAHATQWNGAAEVDRDFTNHEAKTAIIAGLTDRQYKIVMQVLQVTQRQQTANSDKKHNGLRSTIDRKSYEAIDYISRSKYNLSADEFIEGLHRLTA